MRPRHRTRRWRLLTVLLVIALGATVPAAAQDLDDVVEQREQLEEELARASERFEELQGRLARAEREQAELERRVAELEQRAADAEEAMLERARTAYKRGDGSLLATILSAEGPESALERAEFVAALTQRDRARLEGATNVKAQLEQTRELLADKAAEIEAARDELAGLRDELAERLADVEAREQALRSRKARQRTISRGVQSGTYACVLGEPFHFSDTWGAPRSGGRRHKGTDLMAPMNARVYAFTDGHISRFSNSRLGGLGIYLWGDDGVEYYYAHTNGLAPDVWVGKRVEAGEWIGYNGDTGNARGGPPHVHFEIHPGGGGPVNPYPWLVAACR